METLSSELNRLIRIILSQIATDETCPKTKVFLAYLTGTSVKFVDANRFDLNYSLSYKAGCIAFSHSTLKLELKKFGTKIASKS